MPPAFAEREKYMLRRMMEIKPVPWLMLVGLLIATMLFGTTRRRTRIVAPCPDEGVPEGILMPE